MFTPKKQKIIFITLFLIAIWMVLFLDFEASMIERQYDLSFYLHNYQSVINQSLYVMLPLLLLMISHDHDMLFYHPLYAYFGKVKISLYQVITYVLVVIFTFLVVFIYYGIILMLFFKTSATALPKSYLLILIDHLMMLMLILRCSSFKHKSMSYLIAIGFIAYYMIGLDQKHLFLFYLMPVGSYHTTLYTHAYLYKVIYLMMLIIIYLIHQHRRDHRHIA